MKAFALPLCMRIEPNAEPHIVPIAGIVLIKLSFRFALAYGYQLYFSMNSGVQTFIYYPAWEAT